MGVTLTGLAIKDSYNGLIKIYDNSPITGTYKYISDGIGNNSDLEISTSGIRVTDIDATTYSGDNFVVIGSGLVTAPNQTIALIDTDDKSLLTKEYADANYATSDDGYFLLAGVYDADTNTPDLTSPSGVKSGWSYKVSVGGTFYTKNLEQGDLIVANVDDPPSEINWSYVQGHLNNSANIGYKDEENEWEEDQILSANKLWKILGTGTNDYMTIGYDSSIQTISFKTYDNDVLDGTLYWRNGILAADTGCNLGRVNGEFGDLFLNGYANVLGVKSDTDDATKVFATDGSEVTLPTTPTLSRSITIPSPLDTDDATMFFTPVAITITDVRSHITGTTNVVFNIQHASTRTGTGLDVFSSDITLTSTAGQSNNSGFNDETIPANSWVWLNITSVSGTPTLFSATVIYTED